MTPVVLLSLIALTSSPYRPVPGEPQVARTATTAKEGRVTLDTNKGQPCSADKGVGALPFARGKSFCSLDAYLAYLEVQGAIDLPWWRQVRPGVYEHVKRMPGAEREMASRAELMKRFGFAK